MGKILGGLVLQAVGGGSVYGLVRADGIGALVFLAMALGGIIGGFYLVLDGFREFMLRDVLAELKKIAANTTPAEKEG